MASETRTKGEVGAEYDRGAGDRRHPGADVVDFDVSEEVLELVVDALGDLELASGNGPEQRAHDGDPEPDRSVDREAESHQRPDQASASQREDEPAEHSDHRSAPRPELHLFLLWSRARRREAEIVADIRSTFRVVEAVEVTWSRRRFAANLSRFYGEKLPPGSRKQWHCGSGPFLVVVVEDARPDYETVDGGRAVVNRRMLDARARYRELTGGGHRVHATLDTREFEHDVFLLLGHGVEHYARARPWDGRVVAVRRETTGSGGWGSVDELYRALTVTMPWVVLGGKSEVVPSAVAGLGDSTSDLELLVEDAWWGESTVLGRGRRGSRTREVPVGGRVLTVDVWAVGDGWTEAEVERRVLERRVRAGSAFVPSDDDLTLLREGRSTSPLGREPAGEAGQ